MHANRLMQLFEEYGDKLFPARPFSKESFGFKTLFLGLV
jgi:hypothetical protein